MVYKLKHAGVYIEGPSRMRNICTCMAVSPLDFIAKAFRIGSCRYQKESTTSGHTILSII